MGRRRLTLTQRMERRAARVKILTAAERNRGWSAKPFVLDDGTVQMSRLQHAVCVVRRRGLVDDKVLVAAGFNPRPVHSPHPMSSQGRRGPGSPSSPFQEGGRAAREMSGRPPRARGRSARRRASAATDPQARERAPLSAEAEA